MSATNVDARTTSRVVTPKILRKRFVNKPCFDVICAYAPLRIEDTMLLEDFGDNRDSRVYRVGDHKNKSLWCILCDTGSEVTNDTSVDLKEIISDIDKKAFLATWSFQIAHICIYAIPCHL